MRMALDHQTGGLFVGGGVLFGETRRQRGQRQADDGQGEHRGKSRGLTQR